MITKEQWAEIEKDLAGYFGCKDFYLGKDKVSVVREAWKEGERRLIVYFNGSLRPAWTHNRPTKIIIRLLKSSGVRKVARSGGPSSERQ